MSTQSHKAELYCDDQTIRLASYNMRKAVGLDFRREPSRTMDVIASLDADIVALQEADKRLGERISAIDTEEIAERTGLRPLSLGGNDVSLGWHGNAILVRPDIAVLNIRLITLPGLEPRGAVEVHLEDAGRPLVIVATHLGLTRGSRHKQCQTIQNSLDTFTVARSVIMGDFNEWRKVGGLSALTKRHKLVSPGSSFHASRPIAALDRFAIGDAVTLIDAGVKEDQRSKIASDHLPIWADIRIASPSQKASGLASRAM
jgi:endonuclease/exonuclease/phosphatase family metal-dependent hydrolase